MNEETLWIDRAVAAKWRSAYRHHPLALKQSIVEETLQPGASVARIARQHGINANQVFLWRKACREGLLPESGSALLPVTVTPSMAADRLPTPSCPADTGCLTIDVGQIRVRIEGRPDAGVLRLVLAELQRR